MTTIRRNLWLQRLNRAWSDRPIVWLSGVRRVGKTTLARMLPGAVYINCNLPSTGRMLRDPGLFLDSHASGTVLILDEMHRIADPSRLLKIAADEYPGLRILATGSSTLTATHKFRDSLTGRKHADQLRPVLWEECIDWLGTPDIDRRLLHGGLPEALLSQRASPDFFNEWVDSFFARDILELFHIRNRHGFQALFRLLLRQSGDQLELNRLAMSCKLSRPTIKSHIKAMAITHVLHLVRPFSGRGKREIVARPKCYCFDTGFVCLEKGWTSLRPDDRGILWEHLVLDTLRGLFSDGNLFYWQDKSHREIDFVIRRGGNRVDIVECKTSPEHVKPSTVAAFRDLYPEGRNFILCPSVKWPYRIRHQSHTATVCDTRDLSELLAAPALFSR